MDPISGDADGALTYDEGRVLEQGMAQEDENGMGIVQDTVARSEISETV